MKLLGYCCADGERGIQRLLVYEFMSNRSLEDHLFNKTSTLLWKTRLEIMLGAAQGLAYLHEGLEVKVLTIFSFICNVCVCVCVCGNREKNASLNASSGLIV